MAQPESKMAQLGSKVEPEMRKVTKVKLLKKHSFLHCFGPPSRPKTTPRGPQMVHVDPRGRQDDPGDLPEGSRELQEAPFDPPEAAKGSPSDAQEGSMMAQLGSKVGPEMRKVAKVKLFKK